MKRFLFALLFVFLLLGADQTIVQIYDSDLDTTEWEWDLDDHGFSIVVGLDEASWREGIRELKYLDTGLRTRTFDFDQEVPILAYLGERPTGGYAVHIDQIFKRDQDTIIVISRRSPKENEFVTMAFSYPYNYLVVPRQALINDRVIVMDSTGKVFLELDDPFSGEARHIEEISEIFQKREGN